MMNLTIGLDVGVASCQLCAVDQTGAIIEEVATPPTPEGISQLCERLATQHGASIKLIGLEAGSISLWLAWGLKALGYQVKMLNPSSTSAWFKAHGIKSDRQDAIAIAQITRTGWSREVWVRSPESNAIRTALKTRELLVMQRRGLENRLIFLMRSLGLARPKRLKAGLVLDPRVEALPPGALVPIQAICGIINEATASIRTIEAQIEADLKQNTDIERLCTIPGVGLMTAAAFLSAIDDASRFKSADQVASYLGLVPRLNSTGGQNRGGHRITRHGDTMTRSFLSMAAMVVTFNRNMRASAIANWGRRLAERRGAWKAIVAVARKLAKLMFTLLQKRTTYVDPGQDVSSRISKQLVPSCAG